MVMDESEINFEPRDVPHILATYHAQGNLSGAPVLSIITDKARDGSVFLYKLYPQGVHLGISHEGEPEGKHPGSAFSYYSPFNELILIVRGMNRRPRHW